MSCHRASKIFLIFITSISTAGCIVPEAAPLLGHERKKRILHEVMRGVNCELQQAVQRQIIGNGEPQKGDRNNEWGARKLDWLEKWGGIINLTLKIEDGVEFNPGVTLLTPNLLPAYVSRADGITTPVQQSYAFGIGAGAKYNSGREETVAYSFTIAEALSQIKDLNKSCYSLLGTTIESNLDLSDWLDDALEPIKKCAIFGSFPGKDDYDSLPFSTEAITPPEGCRERKYKRDPIETIQHKVDFVLTFEASATPTWRLVRVNSGTTGKLFGANRKDTSTLIVTFGAKQGAAGPIVGLNYQKNIGSKDLQGLSGVATINYESAVISNAIRNSLQQ